MTATPAWDHWWFDDLSDDELRGRLVRVAALSEDAAALVVRHRDDLSEEINRLLEEEPS